MLSLEDGKGLIKLARDSIKARLYGQELSISEAIKKRYLEKQGIFVTLKTEEGLRGCIGFPEPTYPLWKAAVYAAQSAAFSDPRFPPLTEEEFEKISVEISVLTKPELIMARNAEEYLKEIKIGRDGLIIRAGLYSGLLLPQVAAEHYWTQEQFLRQTCMKAGLTMDAWRNLGHQIYKFQAQIFTEEDGEVIEVKQ